MSTVLWTNLMENGGVRTDDADKFALYKHTDKLDAITKRLGLGSFAELCDTTDLRFNTDDDMELPDGMESTVELMARDGAWLGLPDAVRMLDGLLEHLRREKPRFGLLSNDYNDVVSELEEALTFARSSEDQAARFNFSVVM